MINKKIEKTLNEINKIKNLDEKIEIMNYLKEELHKISPFKNEPVDCVLWVKQDQVYAKQKTNGFLMLKKWIT